MSQLLEPGQWKKYRALPRSRSHPLARVGVVGVCEVGWEGEQKGLSPEKKQAPKVPEIFFSFSDSIISNFIVISILLFL